MPLTNTIAEPSTFESDARQREAIEHVHGPLLVIAGAGTGKTTVLTRRIANLINAGYAHPEQILALTYTENAVREMRHRVELELGGGKSKIGISTFHAYCNNLLIRHGKQFGVLDDKDLWIYLRRRIRDLDLNYFIRAGNLTKFLEDLLDFMRRCQDELVGPEQYSAYVDRLERSEVSLPRVCKSKHTKELSAEEALGRCREIATVYARVERMLQAENLGTFGHMITRAHELLQNPQVLESERKELRFILVDEFQDANLAQVKILQKLAGEERNIFAVGDPDQAIYRFRGASSAAFGIFVHNFPGTKITVLDKNRRSITPILKCAYAMISENPPVSPSIPYQRSPLISARDGLSSGPESAPPVDVVVLSAKDTEGQDVAAAIRKRQRETHCRWSDFAVIYRIHSHRDDVAYELSALGIPFSIESMDVMDSPNVRDLLACMGAVLSDSDSASLFRVAALPQFSIDPELLRAGIRALPRDSRNAGVAVVLRQIPGGASVIETVRQARNEITASVGKSLEAIQIIIRKFQLDTGAPPLKAAVEFVKAWEKKPQAVIKSGELLDLVDYLDYFRDAGGAICLPSKPSNAVQLITAHSAKGLEFQHVYILRANSPSFPSGYKEPLFEFPRELRGADSATQDDNKILHEQEERRLFYVAMTRARDSLAIYARQGKGKKDPSPPGFVRGLLSDPSLRGWLRQTLSRGFQTDIFGEAAVAFGSRTAQWLSMPAVSNLHARLSASAVQSYETCPLQFKLEREWRIPSEVPAAMQYGAAIHRVLRAYFDSIRFERPLSEEDLIEMLHADLAQAGIDDNYQLELYENQGVLQLHDFLEAHRNVAGREVLHTEEQFEIRTRTGTIAGRIDRIDKTSDGEIVIVDYKTGKPRSQEDADKSLQLSIYALAAREKWGYNAERLEFYNLEENSPVGTDRTSIQLDAARLKVEEVSQQISEGKFEARAGFHCRFCSYRNLCPETETRTFTSKQTTGA